MYAQKYHTKDFTSQRILVKSHTLIFKYIKFRSNILCFCFRTAVSSQHNTSCYLLLLEKGNDAGVFLTSANKGAQMA